MEPLLHDLLREQASARPDEVFLRIGGDALTFAQADARVDRVAAGLQGIGVRRGDRVALLTTNRREVVELFLACLRLGAVHVPLNAFLKAEGLHHQLDDSGAGVLVVDAAGMRASVALLGDLPALRDVVLLDAVDDAPLGATPYAQLLVASEGAPTGAVDPGDPASIVYTSGTTGRPKGCILPHGYYPNAAAISTRMLRYTPDDVVLTVLPLYHGWALGVVGGALRGGFTAVIEPGFSASAFRRRLHEVGATVANGVGAMMLALLALPEEPTDREHDLRAVFAFPLTAEQRAAFAARFGVEPFGQMYGQTECGAITFSPLDAPSDPDGIGRPSPSFEVRLVDEDGEEVGRGEIGEIVVRPRRLHERGVVSASGSDAARHEGEVVSASGSDAARHEGEVVSASGSDAARHEGEVVSASGSDAARHTMYSGYWGRPDATAEAWRGGWHHTGDYGRELPDGSYAFVDRTSDALRRRGENVSSVELERAIATHPVIADCAVHAVPSDVTEDDIKACVVLGPGAALDPESFFAHCAERLPYFAVPRYLEILDELPRTATLRVRKHELRARGVTGQTLDLHAMGLVVDRDQRR